MIFYIVCGILALIGAIVTHNFKQRTVEEQKILKLKELESKELESEFLTRYAYNRKDSR